MDHVGNNTDLKQKFLKLSLIISASLTVLIGSFFVYVHSINAAMAPAIITYQGRLLVGSFAATTTQNMKFNLYNSLTGGSIVYTASGTIGVPAAVSTTPNNGLFYVALGGTGTNALDPSIFQNNQNLFLEIQIGSETLSPRKQITAAPFAFNAKYLDGVAATSTASTSTYIPISDSVGNFNFRRVTSTGISFTDALGTNATTTNLSVSGALSLPNNSVTDAMINSAATWNAKLGPAYPAVATSSFLGVSYPALATSSFLGVNYPALATSTFLSLTGGTLTGGLIFTTASGTSVTSTNIFSNNYSGSGTFTNVTSTNLYISSTSTLAGATFSGNVGIGTVSPITQLHVPGSVPTAAAGSVGTGANPYTVYVQGRYAYVTNNVANTLQVIDVSNPAAPAVVGSVGTGANPIPVYVQGRYAYVANFTSSTLQVIDVSNPAAPAVVGSIVTGVNPQSVYVQGRYAYIASNASSTLQVIDVSNPAAPAVVGSVGTGANPIPVYVQGRYAYVANFTSSTLQVIDVSNPAAPAVVGSVTTAANPRSLYIQGRYAYVTYSAANNFQIIDVSNPTAPAVVGSVTTAASPRSLYIQGRYAYVANYTAGTLQVIDVSSSTAPAVVGSITTGPNPFSVYVQGRYAYVTNNSAATLQVFDIGGAYLQQLETGGIESGTLNVRDNLQAVDASFSGGVNISQSLNVSGNFGLNGALTFTTASGTSVTSTNIFSNNYSGFGIFTSVTSTNLNVSGSAVFSGVNGITVGTAGWTDNGTASTFGHRAINAEYWQAPLFFSTQSSGVDAFQVANNGARIDFGAGANDYASSDGTTVTFAGPVSSTNFTASGALNVLATTTLASTFLSGMTAGSIFFASTSGQIAQNNGGLFWDNVNKRLGIGTIAPSREVEINGGLAVGTTLGANLAAGQVGVPDGGRFESAAGTESYWSPSGVGDSILQSQATLNLKVYNANAHTSGLFINATGKVGMGTTTPSAQLAVKAAAGNMLLNITSSTDASALYIDAGGNIFSNPNGVGDSDFGNMGTEGLGFNYGGTMYDSEVKIGDMGDTNLAQLLINRHSTTAGATLLMSRSNTSTSAFVPLTNNQAIGQIFFVGISGAATSSYNTAATIDGRVDTSGTISTTSLPGMITFNVTPNGSTNAVTAMTIKSSGLVGIGTSTPSAQLAIKASAGSAMLNITSSTNATALYIDPSGYVGIGTQTMTHPLVVTGADREQAKIGTVGYGDYVNQPADDGFYRSGSTLVMTNPGGSAQLGVNLGTGSSFATGQFSAAFLIGNNLTNNGALVFSNASGLLSQSSTLTWDNVNGRLGVGTTTPGATLDLTGTMMASLFIKSPYSVVAPTPIINKGTGALASITTAIASGAFPYGVAADPSGRFVYVANSSGASVSMYSINQTTGALTSIAAAVSSGATPYGVAVDPTGRYVYVASSGGSSVAIYSINQTTGALTSSTPAIASGVNPVGVAVDPTGRYVYVANNTDNSVSMYSINQSTGALTSLGAAIASGKQPYFIAVDPTGRFVYTANFASSSVSMYSINQSTGVLTSIATPIASGVNPFGVAVDPTGRFVYATNYSSSTVSMYSINQSTGALTSIAADISSGSLPRTIAVDPTGRFVYVANYTGSSVSIYSINQSTGALTSSTPAIAAGANPLGVVVDPTGRFVYVTDYTGNTVLMYSINNFSAGASAFAGNMTFTSASGTIVTSTNLYISATSTFAGATFSGYVGIGTTTPNAQLAVKAAAGTAMLNITSSTDASALYIDTSGNVGIGTVLPITQLHVSGKIPTAAFGSLGTDKNPQSVYVQGRYAYVANYTSSTLQVIDVSNPASPVAVGSVGTGGNLYSVYVQGRYAYVTNYTSSTLQVIDVSNPASPVAVGSVGAGAATPSAVYVQGRYAYVTNYSVNTFQVIDVSNPASPVAVGSVGTGVGPSSLYVQGRYAYVANYTSSTLQVIDVSNPVSPVAVGSVAVSGAISVYAQGRHAYVANNTANTIQIIDISSSTAPVSIGSVGTGNNPYSVYIQGRYAYVVNQSATAQLQIIDISSSTAPVSIGSVGTGGSPHSVYVQGRYAYVANYNSSALQVFDIGGSYIQQLEAGGIESGTLNLRNNLQAVDASFSGGVNISQSLNIFGNFAAGTTSTLAINSGVVQIGTSTVTKYKLVVDSGSNTGSGVGVRGSITATSFLAGTTTLDLAETYPLRPGCELDGTCPIAGDVVCASNFSVGDATAFVIDKCSATSSEKILGVISTNPGFMLGGYDLNDNLNGNSGIFPSSFKPIALSGRVPVNVSTANGPIVQGDLLTSSNIPGVAIKAVEPGRVIGVALQSFATSSSGFTTGTIKMFVNTHWSPGSLSEEQISNDLPDFSVKTVLDKFTLAIKNSLRKLGLIIQNGIVHATEFIAEKVTTKQLCVGGTCVNEQQLQDLLQKTQTVAASPVVSATITTPVVFSTPSLTTVTTVSITTTTNIMVNPAATTTISTSATSTAPTITTTTISTVSTPTPIPTTTVTITPPTTTAPVLPPPPPPVIPPPPAIISPPPTPPVVLSPSTTATVKAASTTP